MASLIVYYAHPGHKHSHVNRHMARAAQGVDGITCVDLYGEYPRFDIDVTIEQQRLLDHDVILFQFPVFWYSSPSIVKEWQDLVLEHGFAYGAGRRQARRANTPDAGRNGAGPEDAYTPAGLPALPDAHFPDARSSRRRRLCNMVSRRRTYCTRRCGAGRPAGSNRTSPATAGCSRRSGTTVTTSTRRRTWTSSTYDRLPIPTEA